MHLIYNPTTGQVFTGETRLLLVQATGLVEIDWQARRAVINDRPDTVSFSAEFDDGEFQLQLCARALTVLCRDHGFQLFINARS